MLFVLASSFASQPAIIDQPAASVLGWAGEFCELMEDMPHERSCPLAAALAALASWPVATQQSELVGRPVGPNQPSCHNYPPDIDISQTAMTSSSGFVPNHGQLADDVIYEAALAGGVLQVQPLGWQLQLSPPLTSSLEPITLTMELVGASSPAAWESSLPLITTVSDYRQADRSRWRSELPQYQQIQARSIYPQIDLQYTVTSSATLKSSYLVAAGADPNLIGWRYPEALGVEIAHDGSLVIHVNATTTITESAPIAWQDLGEDRLFVPVAFRVEQDGTMGFTVGAYDPSHPLVLDPSLTITANPSQLDMTEPRVIQSHPNGTWYVAGCSGL